MTEPANTAPAPAARRRLRTALLFVGAMLFLFEEWLFTGLTRFFAWLGRFGLLRWLDGRLVRLPPLGALIILCVPVLLLFPVKIMGLWMITSGRFVSGCCVMLVAKVVSTAVIARIFLTCRPQLLQMPWFARLHAWTRTMRDRVHDWLAEQPAWNDAQLFVRRMRLRVRTWTGRGSARTGPDGGASIRPGALQRWRRQRKARQSEMAAAGMAPPPATDREGR